MNSYVVKHTLALSVLLLIALTSTTTYSSTNSVNPLKYPWFKEEAKPPDPVPPVYSKVKDLHITTDLVKDGKPNATIIVPASRLYLEPATRIQQAVKKRTGVTLPIITDDSPEAVVPVIGNLIALGNRSTNRTIGALYNLFYTFLDLRYPGPEGYVVRTLHNPFGDGNNVIFVGGSDSVGVEAATNIFIKRLNLAEGKDGSLSIGWLAEIKLGKDIIVPENIKDIIKWDDFGWNTITKNMSLYYMTGEEHFLREFLRLAFPDEKAIKELKEVDWYYLDNEATPLIAPHHYGAHMMMLYWDLIEESPLFTDKDRLRITNAFSQQFAHRMEDNYDFLQIIGRVIYNRMSPFPGLDYRHGTMSALCLYVLGRYFQKDYPNPVWEQAMRGPEMVFASLHNTAWIEGDENDDWGWHNTFIAPILTYMLLSGDRIPVENGVFREIMRAQEVMVSCRKGDRALRTASIGYLHQAAYFLQDGRYIHFREMSGKDTSIFRIGQSFWPEEHLLTGFPDDLVGKWTVWSMPEVHWRERENGYRLDESFYGASYRSTGDAGGDFILVDGYKGDGRDPYHCFATTELRIDGVTILNGYFNQVRTLSDGLAEPAIPRDTALRYRDVIGKTAILVGEVPHASYSKCQRTLVQRTGKYAIFVDDLTFRTSSDKREVQIMWNTSRALRSTIPAPGMLRLEQNESAELDTKHQAYDICLSDPLETSIYKRGLATMRFLGTTRENQRNIYFSVCAPNPNDPRVYPACVRVAHNAAALGLPDPALAVAGEYDGIAGELVVLAEDHLFGKDMTKSGPERLIASDTPVSADWDFSTGRMALVTEKNAEIRLMLASASQVLLDGKRAVLNQKDGVFVLPIKAGRHVIENVKPPLDVIRNLSAYLDSHLQEGRKARRNAVQSTVITPCVEAPPLQEVFSAAYNSSIVDIMSVSDAGSGEIYVAEGNNIHILTPTGGEIKKLAADGSVRMVRWWPEYALLLAGCVDEQVIAFDRSGKRAWVFTSELDPAVIAWGLKGWMKENNPGLYGLTTGVFFDDRSQAFAGSACTLEILDHMGNLVKRLPQFWGPVSTFAFIDGPEGNLNLLAARSPSGHHKVGIINNKNPDPAVRGFDAPPAGLSNIRTFLGSNRNHLFYEDLDGDGIKEVISEVNGPWNRIQVWNAEGTALYAASLGPGDPRGTSSGWLMPKNVRDLDIADLDGDGKKEILVATYKGFIIAFDNQCRKLWSTLLPSPPTVMKCVTPAHAKTSWTIVGCENGTVLVLDEHGSFIRSGVIEGKPTCIAECKMSPEEMGILLGSDKGEVRFFKIGK